jgi:alkylated DNA repair dioxygenase AlkB
MTTDTLDGLFDASTQGYKETVQLTLTNHNNVTKNRHTGNHGTLTLYHHVFSKAEAQQLLADLIAHLNWQQPSIRMHGKEVLIPRKQVWMGDSNTSYRYSGQLFVPEVWDDRILMCKRQVEDLSGYRYNSVLCNLYRDGQDSVSWHADDEPELDPNTPIASLSLGATRRFDLKPKSGQQQKVQLALEDASLLIMSPEVQSFWLHQIAKTKKVLAPRINLTFRRIIPNNR